MKFEIHKQCRFDLNCSEYEYKSALREYLEHLLKIDFSNSPDLLKYFGLSFFHDSIIRSVDIDALKSEFTLIIIRNDDKSDLDEFRRNHGLSEIDWSDYENDPVLYECTFSGVSKLSADIFNIWDMNIIDSELDFDEKNSNYVVRLSLSEVEQIELYCASVNVKLIGMETIKKYTNNIKLTMPYCNICEKQLVTRNLLLTML
ncbi:MAG: hypothetical protein GY795_24055 [Desulfobacterales bacterium]|nr:hypothetical protein [Desulfobacterales bacterium]